jgi:8-oxo-dGTP pyrophosphatase MutT (NUDIX family)
LTAGGERHAFEVRSSRTAYTGRVMALRVDEVVMPGGGIAIREVIEHPGAVAVAAIDEDERVVLVHQYRHPLRRRMWELPAGLLDVHGEDPVVTARRELAEEAGLAATDWAVLVDVASSPGFTDESARVYLAHGLSAVDRLAETGDEEADLEVHRVPLADAVRRVLAGEIVNAIAVGGILAAHLVLSGAASPRPVDAPWPDRPTAWAAARSAADDEDLNHDVTTRS